MNERAATTTPSPPPAAADDVLAADAPELSKLRARIAQLARRGRPHDRLQARHDALHEASTGRVGARRESIPAFELPTELPITERADEIIEALRDHRVLVIAGETGSGKTTQLPKLALAAGCGTRGLIGHTQPRRIAARSVATRIAEETGGRPGERIGFQTRFEQALGDDNLVKVMTDGILLAETRSDPELRAYDCLIIDEAHERSLNIDFLIGYLRRLLQRRDDLRVVITSATIDVERFAAHFGGPEVCPVIEVSGRTHPVEVHWLPPDSLPEAIVEQEGTGSDAGILAAMGEIRRLERDGSGTPPWARDVLVFLPGEREIRDASRLLRERLDWPGLEIVPLYARLASADQQRVFQPGPARRVVLATNVAETSLTVPRIGYVIDAGLARISRYSFRSKLQRLPVEPISRASADQRAGRCGRLAPGICFRLYDEDAFALRDAFTDPEILRTNLAAVVLQMAELGLGEPEDFPFLEPPDSRALSDGRRLLVELGALDESAALTATGRELAALPLDPRLARMVLAGRDRGCLAESLVIVSALASQDPRERPPDRQQAADQAHAEWIDPRSDFLAWLNLWRWSEAQRDALSGSAFRRACQKRFLSWPRLREWRALHRQLHLLCRAKGWRENSQPAEADEIHRALLPGLLGMLGMKTENRDYLGARGQHFHLFPGSALFRKQPPWVMAAEIVETSKVYARSCAAIDPRWIEPEARHLVRRQHDAPHWRRRAGRVMVTERVTLYGLPIIEGHLVAFAPIDPQGARRIFVLEGLARGELQTRGAFLAHNQALLDEIRELEARERRRDLLVGEEALAALYDARIPGAICDARSFERWRRGAEQSDPRILFFDRDDVLQRMPDAASEDDFPGLLRIGELELELGYAFAPGTLEDGVTVTVPLAALPQLRADALEWLVPGLLEEKCIALVKSLPKRVRRELAPVPDHVARVLPALRAPQRFRAGSLRRALGVALQETFGVDVPADAWDPQRLDHHLQMRIRVVDEQGAVVAESRDLAQLQQEQGAAAHEDLARAGAVTELETSGCRDWSFGVLPERLTLASGITVYPALVDEGESVAVRVRSTAREAQEATRSGVVRLLLLAQQRNVRTLQKQLSGGDRLRLMYAPLGDPRRLLDQIAQLAAQRAHLAGAELPRDPEAFAALLAEGRGRFADCFDTAAAQAAAILDGWHAVRRALGEADAPAFRDSTDDVTAWLAALVTPDVLTDTPEQWLPELPRYLQAACVRLQGLQGAVQRDRERIVELSGWQDRLERLRRLCGAEDARWIACRWLLEEYRVSLFAQALGTRVPVSAKRLRREFEQFEADAQLDAG